MAYIFDLVDTWNDGATTFTAVKMNVTDTASNAASRLLDLRLGPDSKFNVDKAGIAYSSLGFGYCAGNAPAFSTQYAQLGSATNLGLGLSSSSPINWYPNTPISGAADTILTRRGIANLRFGAADAATAQPQILSVQSVVAGTSNTAGANLTITGSQGTGLGAGGSIVFQVAPAGSTGTAQNALSTALTIDSTRKLTFADGGAQAYIESGGRASFYSLQITAGSGIASPWVTMADNTLGVNLSNAAYLSWCNNTSAASGTVDVRLYRDTTATLALRNGTAAQRFNVYNTWTTSTNYEAFKIDWITTTNTVLVGTEKGTGGGTARALAFQTDGTTRLTINTNGSIDLGGASQINSSGTYQAGGASGGAALATTGLFIGSGEQVKWSSTIAWSGTIDVGLGRAAAGVVGVTNGSTGAGALQFIEQTAPAAPAANGVRIYAVDNGSGKTQLMALFATGVAQQIAIEP